MHRSFEHTHTKFLNCKTTKLIAVPFHANSIDQTDKSMIIWKSVLWHLFHLMVESTNLKMRNDYYAYWMKCDEMILRCRNKWLGISRRECATTYRARCSGASNLFKLYILCTILVKWEVISGKQASIKWNCNVHIILVWHLHYRCILYD